MLTVLDEYSREALCVNVATTMGSAEVLEALYPLLLSRGKPEYLRSDNGPEFSSVASPGRDTADPDLSRLAMGERLQRTLQWHLAPRGAERRIWLYWRSH